MLNQETTLPYPLPATASTQQIPLVSNHSLLHQSPKDPTSLNLRALRHKSRQSDKVIEILQVRINYLQHKDQVETKRQEVNRRRSEEFQRMRRAEEEKREANQSVKRRSQDEIFKKIKSNSELRASMEYNKSFINSVIQASRDRDVASFKERKRRLHEEHRSARQKTNLELFERARRIKEERMSSSQRSELFYLNKMMDIKNIKERKLNLQLKLKEKREEKLLELRSTQTKLQRMAVLSQKYRHQCQSQYYSSRLQYQQFHKQRRTTKRRAQDHPQSPPSSDHSGIFLS